MANNAVAGIVTTRGPVVFSFLGLDSTRRWDGVHTRAFRWNLDESRWHEVQPPPGPGRLAATAQPFGSKVYVFGGYTVARDGSERSLSNVDVYDPNTDTWTRGADIPVPVDDAVSGVWRDSLIFLVSGWHDRNNVALVQIYDPAGDRWTRATPIPGAPVFGHAGGIAGNAIVYVDGVRVNPERPRFTIEASSWRGAIDPDNPARVTWTRLSDHPGPPLYRAAAGTVAGWVLFAGGTENPYNYTGMGYDGVASAPLDLVVGYHVASASWRRLAPLPAPSMDHRGIATVAGRLILVGGMAAQQEVSRRVLWTTTGELAATADGTSPRD